MATPERISRIHVCLSMPLICPAAPFAETMPQQKRRTTMVRSAVATLESIFFRPTFAITLVAPAKTADSTASHTQCILNPENVNIL